MVGKASNGRLGGFVRLKRRRLGLTQKVLAHKAKVSTIFIHLVESGKCLYHQPKPVRRLAQALGIKFPKLWHLVPKRSPEGVKTRLGKLIYSRRQRLGLTREEVARAAHLSERTITEVELERERLKLGTAVGLARALNCGILVFQPFFYKPEGPKKAHVPCQTRLGQLIRSLRQKSDMTQEQLGKKLGITRQAVSYWEIGKVKGCQSAELRKMALVLKAKPEIFQKLRASRKIIKPEKRTSAYGAYLIRHRLKLGLTQKEVAQMARVPVSFISLAERNTRKLRRKTLEKVTAVLGCQLPRRFRQSR